jgi:hypothetical protein
MIETHPAIASRGRTDATGGLIKSDASHLDYSSYRQRPVSTVLQSGGGQVGPGLRRDDTEGSKCLTSTANRALQYRAGVLVIRFFGSHAEYDRIEAESV